MVLEFSLDGGWGQWGSGAVGQWGSGAVGQWGAESLI